MRPPVPAPGGTAAPDSPGLYPQAVRVLEQLLATLPAGTTVSVWAFGQKMPDAKTAEDTIKELLPPTPLPLARAAVLDPVFTRIRGLEPWDKSPVVRSA